jgi:hypothetical protein
MKNSIKIALLAIAASAVLIDQSANAQCSSSPNNFELRVLPTTAHAFKVQMRYNKENGAEDVGVKQTPQLSLFGMIFAVTWPQDANIAIQDVQTLAKPFEIVQDKFDNAQHKTTTENTATFYHANDMPQSIDLNTSGNWQDLAIINYVGELKAGQQISLLDCSYGELHPNSYKGNSSTDPWLSFYDLTTSVYNEYSPRIAAPQTTGASLSSLSVFPNPAHGDLQVQVISASAQKVEATIVDQLGKIHVQKSVNLVPGENTTTLNIEHLAAGTYMLKAQTADGITYAQKVTVQ